MNNNDDTFGCGCIFAGLIFVIMVLCAVLPNMLGAYIENINGPYGGLWALPLIFAVVILILYIKDKNDN